MALTGQQHTKRGLGIPGQQYAGRIEIPLSCQVHVYLDMQLNC